ncbi:hypothetical protein KP509_11G014200 [Ceratopteris richardii]|nr:hypothetical protein KP509_11G014200 [Ceratopteris richardii]KAH7424581.1 hypothetical protein KP509_11G014200 [Ceratopteris richardii]
MGFTEKLKDGDPSRQQPVPSAPPHPNGEPYVSTNAQQRLHESTYDVPKYETRDHKDDYRGSRLDPSTIKLIDGGDADQLFLAGAPYHWRPFMQGLSQTQNSKDMNIVDKKLQTIIQAHKLQRFYEPPKYQAVLQKLSSIHFPGIAAQWKISKELAYDLASLALYDIVFFCDDSGSMIFEENGKRIDDLKFILSKVADIATLFDDDGIAVRFINSNVTGDGICNAADVEKLLSRVRFSGNTPLGTNFDRKVIQPLILEKARSNVPMAKPVLAILITDGEPVGESRDKIVQVIKEAKDSLECTPYGSGAFAVQIAQVGRDLKTQRFLESLDKDPTVGGMVDCTSYYEMEEEEFARNGVVLTPELWLLKLCVGAIDPDYDVQDE